MISKCISKFWGSNHFWFNDGLGLVWSPFLLFYLPISIFCVKSDIIVTHEILIWVSDWDHFFPVAAFFIFIISRFRLSSILFFIADTNALWSIVNVIFWSSFGILIWTMFDSGFGGNKHNSFGGTLPCRCKLTSYLHKLWLQNL